MKILMTPHVTQLGKGVSGIARVVENYFKYLPAFGAELLPPKSENYDIRAVHAAGGIECEVAHTHGLYWTADYDAEPWEWGANANVIASVRHAKIVTCPSDWVAETFKRDMRISPAVVPHGIDWDDWQEPVENRGFVIWNKNRVGDVCDPTPIRELAKRFGDVPFIVTFKPTNAPQNVKAVGTIPHSEMKKLIKAAGVYLATTKETFGIGILEAMASGIPVLGFSHGGIVDLVDHGVNGYLADPEDYEDLAAGLVYCYENRDVLGENGRVIARRWTWHDAVEKVWKVYKSAMHEPKSTVAIIIPCYNYADKVGRAIESAFKQDFPLLTEIVVVDDGSDDGEKLDKIIEEMHWRDHRVRLLRKENGGVATARNAGIASVDTKYVCCLDADDAIEPQFISACVAELEKDRSLGIAFTGLTSIDPKGATGLSSWPGKPDYDRQSNYARRMNQIPTCCVFRREMWERLGGYRQRYAPRGAGSEDAAFWTAAGSIGYGAKKVTDAGLFIYSLGTGIVGAAAMKGEYKEKDWLAWYPWARDNLHPFASRATPNTKRGGNLSHPVRQYDEPVVSFVIPVGPGHESLVVDALDSLEAQTFRRWEAIVVWDTNHHTQLDDGSVPNKPEFDRLQKAYPYVRWLYTFEHHESGVYGQGAGFARNLGGKHARAPFLVFLDADDYLDPMFLEKCLEAWKLEGAIVYTDYVGIATVDDLDKLEPDLRRNLKERDEETGRSVIGYRSGDYVPELAQRQPEPGKTSPYLWCIMTTLIPKAWHDEIGGFDEDMRTWEDLDYHYRMARAGKCYVRIEEELVIYRFNSGQRRELSRQLHAEVIEYLSEKYEGVEVVGCNCGGRRTVSPASKSRTQASPALSMAAFPGGNPMSNIRDVDDENFVKVKYLSPNRGNHRVIGPVTRIDYGYHSGGTTMMIHRDDLQPHLFMELETIAPPRPPKPPTPEPVVVPAAPSPMSVPELMEPVGHDVVAEAETVLEDLGVEVQRKIDLQALPGITRQISEQLERDGIETVDQFLDLEVEGLMQYTGVGDVKGKAIIEAVKAIVALAEAAES